MTFKNRNLGREAYKTETRPFSDELKAELRERHERIKKELRNSLSTMIGLSGGAIALSLTLLEKIAPKRIHVGLLAAAWTVLGTAILTGVASLLQMTASSIRYQKELEAMYQRGTIEFKISLYSPPSRGFFNKWLPGTIWRPGEKGVYVTQILFTFGAIILAVFVLWNMLAR